IPPLRGAAEEANSLDTRCATRSLSRATFVSSRTAWSHHRTSTPSYSGSGTLSSPSPGRVPKRSSFQLRFACELDTKLHQMWRSPSMGSPPSSLGVGDGHVLGLRAVDGVAEPPAPAAPSQRLLSSSDPPREEQPATTR